MTEFLRSDQGRGVSPGFSPEQQEVQRNQYSRGFPEQISRSLSSERPDRLPFVQENHGPKPIDHTKHNDFREV
jgi:hypothetical protein